jgi:integrase
MATTGLPRRPAESSSRRRHFTARTPGQLRAGSHAVDWIDAKTPGLSLRVTPAGARTWYLLYKKGRTSRRVKLGSWPAVGLAKARTLARGERLRIETEHADPAHERKVARDFFTVSDLRDLYLRHAETQKRTWRDDGWRLDRYIVPAWGTRPVREIGRADVHAVLDKIVAAGKPIQANRVQALISKLWNFAMDRGHAELNPCHRMAKPARERVRDRVLTDDDLRALWEALDSASGDAADAVRLRLLTGQRGGEVHRARWVDVDLKAGIWTIPAAHAKNRRPHRVPLTERAAAILKARLEARPKDEARVFPGLYHQREDLRELATIHAGAYRWHDLRRTVATRLARAGYPEEVVGRVLNHARRGVTATVYNQHAYDAEKRQALETWARVLDDILAGRDGGAVLPFVR